MRRGLVLVALLVGGCLDTASLGRLYRGGGGGGGDGDGGAPAECTTGAHDCLPADTPRACVNGLWQSGAPCAGATAVCADGQCVARCATGARDCSGNVPRLCQDGDWQAQPACAGNTPVCVGGACVACVDGAKDCYTEVSWLCVGGHWEGWSSCNGTSICSGRACVACPSGMADCDGDAGNGCEARLDTPPNCGACKAGVVSCYPDDDGDHYGALGSVAQPACGPSCPAGRAPAAGDCDDGNADINPGRTMPLFSFPAGAKSFDANCDGHVTVSFCSPTDQGYCPGLGTGGVACGQYIANACDSGNGWQSGPPGCGQTGTWVSCTPITSSNSCAVGGTESWIAGCL